MSQKGRVEFGGPHPQLPETVIKPPRFPTRSTEVGYLDHLLRQRQQVNEKIQALLGEGSRLDSMIAGVREKLQLSATPSSPKI